MIDSGMQAVQSSIGSIDMNLVTVDRLARIKRLFTVDGVGKLVIVGALVILLLPAALVVSVVAILVPCFLRVPVCGPSIPVIRTSASK